MRAALIWNLRLVTLFILLWPTLNIVGLALLNAEIEGNNNPNGDENAHEHFYWELYDPAAHWGSQDNNVEVIYRDDDNKEVGQLHGNKFGYADDEPPPVDDEDIPEGNNRELEAEPWLIGGIWMIWI